MVERLHRQMKDALYVPGAALPPAMGDAGDPSQPQGGVGDLCRGSGIWACAGGTWSTTVGSWSTAVGFWPAPEGTLAVIPAVKRTYAEAAAITALERAPHVYVLRGGVGPQLAENYTHGCIWCWRRAPRSFSYRWGRERKLSEGTS